MDYHFGVCMPLKVFEQSRLFTYQQCSEKSISPGRVGHWGVGPSNFHDNTTQLYVI